jgi:hypothetical protein
MKKIMMTKYGFLRWPEEDFSDDGNRFTCYKVGDCVRVSKLVADGEVYISARIDGIKLPYDVYSALPHYRALDALNGVSLSSITEADLYILYENCVAYEQEYKNAENNIALPTLDEIKEQCRRVQLKAIDEFNEIEELLQRKAVALALTLTDYKWASIRKYLKYMTDRIDSLNPDKYARSLIGSYRSIEFCKPTCSDLKDSYYYRELLGLINQI